jgi:hypothetical protein
LYNNLIHSNQTLQFTLINDLKKKTIINFLDNLKFYENSYFWFLKRFYFFNNLKNNHFFSNLKTTKFFYQIDNERNLFLNLNQNYLNKSFILINKSFGQIRKKHLLNKILSKNKLTHDLILIFDEQEVFNYEFLNLNLFLTSNLNTFLD